MLRAKIATKLSAADGHYSHEVRSDICDILPLLLTTTLSFPLHTTGSNFYVDLAKITSNMALSVHQIVIDMSGELSWAANIGYFHGANNFNVMGSHFTEVLLDFVSHA